MHKHVRICMLIPMLLVAGALSIANATPAAATTYSCTTNATEGIGYLIHNAPNDGAQMNTRHVSPVICSNPGGSPASSRAYTAISAAGGYASAGEILYSPWSTAQVYYYTECESCDTIGGTRQTPDPVLKAAEGQQGNSSYNDEYTAYIDPFSGYVVQQIAPANDPTLTQTYYTYSLNENWAPNEYSWMGEIQWQESQVPGITSDHDVLSEIQGLNSSGSWQYETSASAFNNTKYGSETSFAGDSAFGIWDTRY